MAAGYGRPRGGSRPNECTTNERWPAIVPDPEAEWFATWDAACIVGLEAMRLEAFAGLTTEQLRSLVWLGLTDDGWSALYAELAARRAEL
jgi:hypothetical protein